MYMVQLGDKKYYIEVDDSHAKLQKIEEEFDDLPDFDDEETYSEGTHAVVASLPGNICRVLVQEGSRVEKNDVLFLCETMKMELEVLAPCAGTLTRITISEGKHVEKDQLLAEITPE